MIDTLISELKANLSAAQRTLDHIVAERTAQTAVIVETAAPLAVELKPAVNPKKSVTPAAIISLINGKSFVSLKRHLSVNGYTPDSYRAAFGLSATYPMVASDYAAKRSETAKRIGLGRKPKTGSVAVAV